MKDLYYTLGDNGYDIFDHNDPLYHVSQYGEYNKPMDSTKTIEENAVLQVADLMTEPEIDPDNTYGVPDETYHAIIDDYTMELVGGAVNE